MGRRRFRKTGERVPIEEFEANGETFQIEFDGDEFTVEVASQPIRHASVVELRKNIMAVMRVDTRVSVPAMSVEFGAVEPITLIGIHNGNGNILYKDKDGKTRQRYTTRDVLRPVSGTELDEYKALLSVAKAADKAVEKWKKDRLMDPTKAIQQAQRRKAIEVS